MSSINIAFLNSKKLSIKRKVFIIITVLCLLILSFLFCFYNMYKNFIDSIYNNQNDSKIISVYNTLDEYSSFEKVIDSYNNSNIVYVEKNVYSLYGYVDNTNRYSFKLNRDLNYFVPDTEFGRKLKSEGEIICPSKASYYNFDNLKYNELIDLKNMIGNKITLSFHNGVNSIVKDYILVGTYNADLFYSYNDCYIKQSEYDFIVNNLKDRYTDNDTYVNLFNIYVNNYKNVNEVNQYLVENGISTSVVSIDDSFLNYSLLLSYLFLIIMVIILSIFLIKFYKSYYQEEYYNIALYKALGYDENFICKIMFWEIEIILFIALIIATFLLCIIIFGVTMYLKQFVIFRLARINFPIIAFMLYFLLISIINYLFLKADMKSISSYSVKGLSEL